MLTGEKEKTYTSELNSINAYPNPFTDNTSLNFSLFKDDIIDLSIFDIHGNRILSLYTGKKLTAGFHSVYIKGQELPNGVYFCLFKTKTKTFSLKIVKLN